MRIFVPGQSLPFFGKLVFVNLELSSKKFWKKRRRNGVAVGPKKCRREKNESALGKRLPATGRGLDPGLTAAEMKRCVWVKPVVVSEVKFTEWTRDDRLRHPVFLGLRDDKKASQVVRETAN